MKTRNCFAFSVFGFLTSCSGQNAYHDQAEPMGMEDFLPPPDVVTRENARDTVRKCLQSHRRANDTPDEQFGYSFGVDRFVQLRHLRPSDRALERIVRTYVKYRAIKRITLDPFFDVQYLKNRFRLELVGTFRRWEAPVRSSRPMPDLDSEPVAARIEKITMVLDDAVVAQRLKEALVLLGGAMRLTHRQDPSACFLLWIKEG